jgi:hypothetical protein
LIDFKPRRMGAGKELDLVESRRDLASRQGRLL